MDKGGLIMKYPALFLLTLSLTACGGGSSSSDSGGDVTLNPGSNIITNDTNLMVGQSIEFLLLDADSTIDEISWTQTSGTTVDLLSNSSKAIAFTIPASGDYSFDVNYQADGSSQSETVSFSATTGTPKLVVRLGHSVVEDAGVSLRVFSDSEINTDSITWSQVSGPSIVFDSENIDTELAIFTAPSVSEDSVVVIQVQASSTSGSTYTDSVSILVENTDKIPSNAYFNEDNLANVHPYNSDSPYKDTLVDCVYSNALTSSCELGDLPELARDSNGGVPTIDQVMDRVVVSHDWMGVRFKQYLEAFDNDDDFKRLLRATTAIVLSYDVRPSFYWAATGAIYLDPNNLWITPDERDTINEAPDYRSSFGSDLQFVMPWRYVKDNDYVTYNFDVANRQTRDINDIHYELADLLYHELAHANDFLPSTEWNKYTSTSRFLDAAFNVTAISEDMIDRYPLISDEMKGLAAVSFMGETATSTEKSYQPDDISVFYKNDISNGFYNYTNEKEDLAILFEALMMASRFDILRDTAVTSDQAGGYVVSWGQRNRVAVPGIIDRASYVAERLLPEYDLALIDSLATPVEMTSGVDWFDNIDISPILASPLFSLKDNVGVYKEVNSSIKTYQPHGRAIPNH